MQNRPASKEKRLPPKIEVDKPSEDAGGGAGGDTT